MTNCYRALTHVILLAAFSSPLFAQFFSLESTPVSPKREFRSVWLTTVLGLDWPQIGAPAQEQEQSLREIIRKSEAMGLNAVVFQVVSRGDAMYPSERLPWAPWLSGLPGFDPGWDPLAVAIEESHRLGMELHAWYNVYRIGDSNTPVSSTEEPLHVRFAHPEWVETVGNEYWLNPAFPELRDWLVENVREIVEKYDIDAIHFDFIRTSTSGYARDSELKQQYNPDNIQDIGDWRRENINKFVRAVYPAVKGIKPWVKVGSTPIGHYKATAQINWPSLRGYTDVFQDSRRWLQEEVHDYLAPQVYWAIGQSTDTPRFELLAHDWTNESYERHVYVGIAAYKPNVFVEIPAEIDTTRNAGADGQVFFRYANINTEPPPFGNLYQYKAIPPVMAWRDSVSPNPPSNLRYEPIAAGGPAVLRWDIPAAASDGDTASRYVLYRLTTPTPDQSDFDNPANILSLSGETATTPPVPSSNGPWYYAISALDRNYNESEAGNVIHVAPPPSPVLAMPTDGASGLPQSIDLSWNASALSASYHLQISSDSAFASDFVLNESGLVDTVKTATGFAGQQLYFWRVGAANAGGTSEFSPFFSFTTGFPATPLLASPANFMDNVSVSPTIVWMSTQAADSYRLQLSLSSNFTTIALDTAGVQDTSVAVTELLGRRIYFWRVSASNEIGTSLWSEVWRFRTETPTTVLADNNIPLDFLLYQNYPNPFNAMTHIRFTLPEEGMTKLIVYDLLGREVALLVNEQLPPGRYEARFEADHAASGTYIYVLTSGPYRSAKKLILLK